MKNIIVVILIFVSGFLKGQENAPQPAYLLLDYGQYQKINKQLSELKGFELGEKTARSRPMNPTLAKTDNGTAYVLKVTSKERQRYPELLDTLTMHDSYVPADSTDTINISEVETNVVNWTMNHYRDLGIDNSKLVTYIASQGVENYPPIPEQGEWCERKVYAYNGDKAKCIQPHTRTHRNIEQEPALWLVIETVTEGYPEFVQPTGAHDAYAKGDRVTFQGKDYESLIDANVWSPATYPAGWKEL